jgi:succinate dehydrogenase / fumarate reductase flavoprotein subunit
MWEHCGVVREASDMERALAMLEEVRALLPIVDVRPSEEGWGDLAQVLDLQAMLGTAEATLHGAIAREESRGAHIRSDFPGLNPRMELSFIVGRGSDDRLTIEPAPLQPIPEQLIPWLERAADLESVGRLLE